MKFSLTLALITFAFAVSAQASDEGKHLLILSGQSNMARLDPSVSFTPTLDNHLGKNNFIVVKDAKGGQPIRRWYKQWKPVEGEMPADNGDLYDRLMVKVNGAIQGEKIKTVTFVWMQGERDAKDKQGRVYADSLKGLFKQLSMDLNKKDINIVIGRINDFDMENKKAAHWTSIREAQVEVAESLPRATWVNTDDLNGKTNDIHALEDGYDILGERFALKAIELIKVESNIPAN
ncbi:sialate O-acetylesterase [Shewanella sp. D64]|uniref:sialate O-acetylesterase n=1 Tax=unclassified Shewanella TaxID=196818 RepID=UPI0022BA6190|nr:MULTISPECIES: sialate O-acetylesterase [unclassified Shewanella]MEC4726882.1 sialate O-acetylesterase [Shewanella sp. D64]MEC4738621.1 sialate O-acetylesterase [Shewanella sp. E94]WBJ93836.1 sialate O-acetylesterase [Shewanella sp. MTB7]